ncbi:hypothetical protein [Zooshikella ganghwensis]|uniref:Uncharacterized protein n=1 Tax=Zooshikella ganghwensis TaxID=202772 RepID=A0A4P9VFM0_9GAMM|nr:hypothetical protein [Zooshikella ganghwensis]RDH41905.1 hypothetical protein B9G39_26170 [Zooshikella ganghwensis]
MKIVGKEFSGSIESKTAEELAKIFLPVLDIYEDTKEKYKYALNDDGDHLYIEFKEHSIDNIWFQDVENSCYILHISYKEYSDTIEDVFFRLKNILDLNGFNYSLEVEYICEYGTTAKTDFYESHG